MISSLLAGFMKRFNLFRGRSVCYNLPQICKNYETGYYLQYLIDFLENKNIEKTKIFDQLKCTVEEAEILRHITSKHIKGNEENSVFFDFG